MTDAAVILLVEDRQDDIILIQKAFHKSFLRNPMKVVRDGAEAIEYLAGSGQYSNRQEFPLPSLILLDLKMPRIDGFEVLEWLRAQPGISNIPVLVLTSSRRPVDVSRAYKLGANSFLVKPVDFENYTRLGKVLLDHWLKFTTLPQSERPPRKSETPK